MSRLNCEEKDCLAGKTLHAPIEIDDSGINQGSSTWTSLFSAEDEEPQHQKSEVYDLALVPKLFPWAACSSDDLLLSEKPHASTQLKRHTELREDAF